MGGGSLQVARPPLGKMVNPRQICACLCLVEGVLFRVVSKGNIRETANFGGVLHFMSRLNLGMAEQPTVLVGI